MALVKCIECSNLVSDKAETCPKCGCPTNISIQAVKDKQALQQEQIENAKNNFHCWKCQGTQFTFVKAYGSLMGKCPLCGALTGICEQYDSDTLPDNPSAQLVDVSVKIKPSASIECPYCHSTNTKKISTTSRAVSFFTLGLAGKKSGKQWHCNKCGSDF